MLSFRVIAMGLMASVATAYAHSASEVAEADAQRKKPLQRCDQVSESAEIDCLHKARERIVEARQKRQAAAKANTTAATRVRGDAREPPVKK